MIDDLLEDFIKIYKYIISNDNLSRNGKPSHDVFQDLLYELASKYSLECKKEYVGVKWYNSEKNAWRRGRIDIAYFKEGEPFLILEIDSGLKGHSVRKLKANNQFKYRVWYCYNKKANTKEYYELLDKIDPEREIIYITKNDNDVSMLSNNKYEVTVNDK